MLAYILAGQRPATSYPSWTRGHADVDDLVAMGETEVTTNAEKKLGGNYIHHASLHTYYKY
jgi:hypothetical protein